MAQCLTPFTVKDKTDQQIAVPCGRCPACYSRRISGWSFRLQQQDKVSESSYFVTLTYGNETIPYTVSGNMSLKKRDTQLFFKRLRKVHVKSGHTRKLSYYVCGEYGTDSHRPHYHAILFNADLQLLIGKKDAFGVSQKLIELDGKTPFYSKSWHHGHITLGPVNVQTIGYVLKYMSKLSRIPIDDQDDRPLEFSCMSKGLGMSYLTPAMYAWHHADMLNRMYCNLTDGKKISMPRYYKQKLYTDSERESIGEIFAVEIEKELRKNLAKNPNYYADQATQHKAQFDRLSTSQRTRNQL